MTCTYTFTTAFCQMSLLNLQAESRWESTEKQVKSSLLPEARQAGRPASGCKWHVPPQN